jgi:NAD(P)-dependent dehydrogenase (short-subunit alcohol dehydrogenase family)
MDRPQGRLNGRVAVVTGGTKGIGQGIVLRFIKEGASVVYCSRSTANDAENRQRLADIPGAAARAHFVAADVGNRAQMRALVEIAVSRFGRLDILVNNAQGIAALRGIEEKPDSDYAMTLATGFYHSLWTIQAAAPHMRRAGGGRIINFSSHWNIWGQPFSSDYNITKAANEALTRSAAREFGADNITVNCIIPAGASFAYGVWKQMNPGAASETERTIPMRRMGDCERDIAGAVLGLVSANGRFITGQVFCVDGGAWAAAPVQQHESVTDIHAGRHQRAVEVT